MKLSINHIMYMSRGDLIAILLFADNFWLLSSSRPHLEQMTNIWHDLLAKSGLHADHSKSTWCTTAPDARKGAIHVGDTQIARAPRETGFTVLGTQLTFDGRTGAETERRIKLGWKTFCGLKPLLCCRKTQISRRLDLLKMTVYKTVLWCAGSWNPTRKDFEKLNGALRQMFAIMVGVRMQPGETPAEFKLRRNKKLKILRGEVGLRPWSYEASIMHYTWMGHVARISSYDPLRWTHRVLSFKDMSYIHRRQVASGGNQCHGRNIHVWRLETRVVKMRGRNWREDATDRQSWQTLLENWVAWEKHNEF